jgi:hypothetical protein
MSKRFFSTVVMLLLSGINAQAFIVWGPGNDTCGRFMQERSADSSRFHMEMSWIAGFVSAQNQDFAANALKKAINAQVDVDMLRGTDNAALEAWIAQYCGANPLKDLTVSAAALSKALFDRLTERMKAAKPQ